MGSFGTPGETTMRTVEVSCQAGLPARSGATRGLVTERHQPPRLIAGCPHLTGGQRRERQMPGTPRSTWRAGARWHACRYGGCTRRVRWPRLSCGGRGPATGVGQPGPRVGSQVRPFPLCIYHRMPVRGHRLRRGPRHGLTGGRLDLDLSEAHTPPNWPCSRPGTSRRPCIPG